MRGACSLLGASALAIASALACAPSPPSPSTPLVLASTTVLADLAANVAGDRVRVESLVPAGAHVEEYAPRPDDAARVARARLVLLNGLGLDRWAAALVRSTPATVVTLSDGLPTLGGNPHLWFDADLSRAYVTRIRDALSDLDPAGAAGYRDRASAYDGQLAALDAELRAKVATLAPERRKLVTSHDAFPYLARAYGFTIVGFAQPEPDKEPSPAELAALVGAIRAARVPVIFSEAGVSPRIAETLAREAGVAKVVSDLPTDSLQGPPADTYPGFMRTVVGSIVEALR